MVLISFNTGSPLVPREPSPYGLIYRPQVALVLFCPAWAVQLGEFDFLGKDGCFSYPLDQFNQLMKQNTTPVVHNGMLTHRFMMLRR